MPDIHIRCAQAAPAYNVDNKQEYLHSTVWAAISRFNERKRRPMRKMLFVVLIKTGIYQKLNKFTGIKWRYSSHPTTKYITSKRAGKCCFVAVSNAWAIEQVSEILLYYLCFVFVGRPAHVAQTSKLLYCWLMTDEYTCYSWDHVSISFFLAQNE